MELKSQGKKHIERAEKTMKALEVLRRRFQKEKPFAGVTIGMALHVTKETAVLVKTLRDGGAFVAISGCNPLSTQDDIVAALRDEKNVAVFGRRGESIKEYYENIRKVIGYLEKAKKILTIDDGCDLVTEVHKSYNHLIPRMVGGCEETTTGVLRLNAMQKDKALKYPVIAVNDNLTKHLMDNYYGTGQSAIDGILRASNVLLAGKSFVVVGYGDCGRGVAKCAKGLGAHVIVTEVNPFRALQAHYDGFEVMAIAKAAKTGDIFVTVTGNKHVIDRQHLKLMKPGVILANAGHFNHEINIDAVDPKRQTLLGEGRLVNLVCAEGHPSEVMSMSFCGQALACEHLLQNAGKLKPGVHTLPESIDQQISKLQLEALSLSIDTLTAEQKKYLSSWQEGT